MNREPALLWKHFEEICRIPRGSGNEAGMRAYIRAYATQYGFGYAEDNAGNCLVSVPGRGKGANAQAVIIQSHSDMVCVKDEDVVHDFTRDPIRTREVDWTENGVTRPVLMATGTTLGADNGIGVVSGLTVAIDPEVADCPPLELLVTVEEETGLTGARRLDPALLRTDLLINLDMEGLGQLCVSCAGGRDMMAEWPVSREAAAGHVPVRFVVTGLPGGHSGVDIDKKHGNALLMLLQELLRLDAGRNLLRLASASGGMARNVIPSHAEAVVYLPASVEDEFVNAFNDSSVRSRITGEIIEERRDAVVCEAERLDPATAPLPLSLEATHRILSAICAVPNGVQAWSPIVPGLVETSNNVAVLSMEQNRLRLQDSTRSSREGAIEVFQKAAETALIASGATVTFGEGYPGWPADPDSALMRLAETTFAEVLGKPPLVMAVHAGLECGVLKGKRPTLQMVSFGPDMADIHTTKERIMLDSVPPFYACLKRLLHHLATVA